MTTEEKQKQLNRHKAIATGLFVCMVLVYIATLLLLKRGAGGWASAVNAFSEAAMVGALADWFAVTALFYHPLGIPIPHTNLIENGKQRIGANLGGFVVNNFLTPANLRPYLDKLKPSGMLANWLRSPSHQQVLLKEASHLLTDILGRVDDQMVTAFLTKQGTTILSEINLSKILSSGVRFAVEHNEHEAAITMLAGKIRGFILENEELVRGRVKSESYFFVPGFVNNKLAEKITTGLAGYFKEIEEDKAHRLRQEISQELLAWSDRLLTDPEWEVKFQQLKAGLLATDKLEEYARTAWAKAKATLIEELSQPDTTLMRYIGTMLQEGVDTLATDEALQAKIDNWARVQAYSAVLRYKDAAGELISGTVGNWPARELSQKLELEVGKDLQYIRINGTLVGGLVGLLIHLLTIWLD
ncbi:MAG: DUF445 domain-containing protein [Sphingobacteriales bacterium]|nr:MAG: DUF445 domain-containing protein [Sphingobacteriales bacterium]